MSTASHSHSAIRVALVGCGAISQSLHLPVLAGHEEMQLVAVVDRAVERARNFAQGYGVPHALADSSELHPGLVDAAILATPAAHHAPGAIDLMRRGMHVLVEKPMALAADDAEQMVRVADETGACLAVGYFRRLYPSLRLARALLDSGRFGPPLRFEAEGGGMYSWAAATLANMRRELAGGGVLIDFGSHILDLLFYLFDEPFEVLAYQDNNLGGVESDCAIDARLSYKGSPIEGRIELARTRMLGSFVSVECEEATLTFDVGDRYGVRVTPRESRVPDPFDGRPRQYGIEARWQGDRTDESWFETFRTQIDDWLDAIREKRQPRLSGRSALPTARMIDACYARRSTMPEPWVSPGIRENAMKRHRRVLLTGATGFIGSRVAEVLALRDGCEVRAVVHNPGNASRLARLPVEMVQADLQDDAALRRLVDGCDAVVHCAIGTAWGQRNEIFKVTVDGTRRLAEAAQAAGVDRFVHLSTISVYGDDAVMTGTIDENTPVRPSKGSDYGESKAEAERVLLDLARRGLPVAILRPARVFGPFSRIFIERPLAALAQKRFQWRGRPDVPADMVYVDSVVHAILLALGARADDVGGQVFAVGDGDPVTWYEFYQHFADALGLDLAAVPVVTRERAGVAGGGLVSGVRSIITSPEFKRLGRRVLDTDGVGTIPRWSLEHIPGSEAFLRRMVGADDSLPVYHREPAVVSDVVEMGSGGALVSIDKLRRVLGFEPPVARPRALELTLQWVRHARVV